MTSQSPSILNLFTLLYPSSYATATPAHHAAQSVLSVNTPPTAFLLLSLVTAIASISLCCVVATYFYRTYRFSGYGYLLGLPTGFVILGTSFVFGLLNLVYSYSITNESSENLFFWIQLALQSEGFSFMALSYMLKNRGGSAAITSNPTNGLLPATSRILFSPHSWFYSNTATRLREIVIAVLPMILISTPLMIAISALFVQPILNDTELKEMSVYITLFNIVLLGYIFIKCLRPLVKAANIRLLYIPAAFALLWLEQYSLIINYFDNNQFAVFGSIIFRVAGLGIFVYAIYRALSRARRKEMEIET